MSEQGLDPKTKRILTPLLRTGLGFYIALIILVGLFLLANYAWSVQLDKGLAVTGLNDRVSWGIYISVFIYFIGISYGGTCVSAILRLTGAEWRRPITRLAETSTVAALLVAAIMPMFDLGHPEKILDVVFYGRIESPLVWDFISVGTYLAASMLFFYLALIPDLAILDRVLPKRVRIRRTLYRVFKMRWEATPAQVRKLERALMAITIIIIPIAVSAHTVLSWMFGMTTRAGWHSSIFGPYFVAGALFSGIGIVVIAMAVVRWAQHLEDVITDFHFRRMADILLVFGLAYLYMTLSEYLTMTFQPSDDEKILVGLLTSGPLAPYFWISTLGLVLAVALLAIPRTRTVAGITMAALVVNVALLIKRFIIVVPSMQVPLIPGDAVATYSPTWVEWALIGGSFAAFGLIFLVASKLVPMVSIWEVSEGDKAHAKDAPAAPEARTPSPEAVASVSVVVATEGRS
ncbi:MAG: polysulfide reductase NrfD [Euryarchaeota archaeon]|nr:polysulfide reductase NrfD [Euryarchaeota archaeon]